MVKYETKTGKNKWEYYEYYGLDKKTGKQIRLRGKGFNSKTEAKLDFQRKLKAVQDGENATLNKRIKFEDILNEYLTYYKDSGIKPGTYKKFKDEMVTLLYELDIDPKNAQHRLRHKNLKTTMDIYTHLSEKQKQAPTKQLNAFSSQVPTSMPTFSEETKKKRKEH